MGQEVSGLFERSQEKDSCGVGFVVDVAGRRSHRIVRDGVTILKNLMHRGALGGDSKTGDGAGMMLQLHRPFFARKAAEAGLSVREADEDWGVGFFFLPQDAGRRAEAERMVEAMTLEEGGEFLGWRDVPVCPDCLGDMARDCMPFMRQAFVRFAGAEGWELERRLYVLRRVLEKEALRRDWPLSEFYIPSLSGRTVVYKGMFVAPQFEAFYPDLADRDFESCFALIHQRYSTNTFPSWPLAQPFRHIAHNGEINALRGNINAMRAREGSLASPLFGEDIRKLVPVILPGGSDSAIFDNVFELLVKAGRTVGHAAMMMVPEAFGPAYHMSTDKRAFYEYHAACMEPWDGPAAIVFTDGVRIGAVLDRNGLRPIRYTATKSGLFVLASETGVLDIAPEDVLFQGRLSPGKMILVDTEAGRIRMDNEVKAEVSRRRPYRRWLEENRIELKGLFEHPEAPPAPSIPLVTLQAAFGYTLEDLEMILRPMAEDGQEPVGSMGDDEAPAVLAETPQPMTRYFKQLFAQVTNPPIDPYREHLVMSLMSFAGRERNLLDESPQHCRQLKLQHPVLTDEDVERLLACPVPDFRVVRVSTLFPVADGPGGMAAAVDRLCAEVERQVDEGAAIVVLSDREVDADRVPVPAVLAVSAVTSHLVSVNKKHLCGLVVQTAEAKEVMDFAVLIGFGASAVNPWLAFAALADLKARGAFPKLGTEQVLANYITAVKKGLLKVMSKMGISTIRSYRGAALFEAVGLDKAFVDRYFPGVPSRIGGVGLEGIARETLDRHTRGFGSRRVLPPGGRYKYRRDGERHRLTPEAIVALHKAVREEDWASYRLYADLVNDRSERLCTLRGLFTFKPGTPVPLEEVEPEESIVRRFVTAAMSFGSISKEAHETIAIAMNRLGAASNSGEGGEDEERYVPLPNGDSRMSKVKQVASGRFGVTIDYLVNSKELQIKMAQGAKPGEGGQLPGHKVDPVIAKVRHSTPGVMLISPPPHHDIYSIEDLAQLIYDLKRANPEARVSVKLVSEVGVGTVAAGVAKAGADMVLISGGDGGTGASPLSSIKHAGAPWEIGLAETQQTLVANSLRDRIRVQVDGQIRTGRDVVVAALLGAEEYGFGTIALVAIGCVMMRKCHLNTCPVGIATQDARLRARFQGKPEHLVNFMRFVARDVRELMASLGFRTVDEMVGRSDRLATEAAVGHWKARGLDFSALFVPPPEGKPIRCVRPQPPLPPDLDRRIIEDAREALERGTPVRLAYPIRNTDRTAGATLSWAVAKRYGSRGLPDGTIHCKFEGVAGQSFGAFLAKGITFELEGEANDYMGKGLSGGRIVLYPPRRATYRSQNNIITGNVCLFGATSGEVFIHGMAGERFAVRNSGAVAVVEGVGDHGCEYMTGGVVVVLGSTGVNFAAGMSGGIAYVLDESQLFDTRCNLEMVDLEPVSDPKEAAYLRSLVERHVALTGSAYAAEILRDWAEMLPRFVKVFPIDYRKALERIRQTESREAEAPALTEEVR